MNGESGVAGRMAIGRDGNDPRGDFGARLELLHLPGHVLEDAPGIEKVAVYRAFRRPHFRLIHPERPFRLRHQDLRIGENLRAILALDAVDVVGMKMRD